MKYSQKGMTTLGLMIVLAIVACAGYAGFQLLPFYLENFKIVQVLSDVKNGLDGQNATTTEVRKSLQSRLYIEAVELPLDEFSVSRGKSGIVLEAYYEKRARYIGNVYLVVEFDESVEIVR
ncbi:MAG: DUF4845 domain-containing protein [Gammaproteobacteria bacterium]